MTHLFFSYAHADAHLLQDFYQLAQVQLQRKIWFDRRDIADRDLWLEKIRTSIRGSDAAIFAITPAYVADPSARWVIYNVEIPEAIKQFRNRNAIFLYPILFPGVQATDLPKQLAALDLKYIRRVIDARDGDYDRVLRELGESLPSASARGPFQSVVTSVPDFKGRQDILIGLHKALHPNDDSPARRVIGLWATGGMGKTQIAIRFANCYRDYFPAGVFWMQAAQPEYWKSEFARHAESLILPVDSGNPDRFSQLVLAFKAYLQAHTVQGEDALLIMDNVSDPADLTRVPIVGDLSVLKFCEETGVHLILTSRVRAKPDAIHWIEVGKLPEKDALDLLRDAWDARWEKPRTDPIDEIALKDTAALFDYLPLPIGWMAAALRQTPELPPAEMLSDVRAQGVDDAIQILKDQNIDLGTPGYYEGLVFPVLDWQIEQASKRSPHLLLLLQLTATYKEIASVPRARLRLLSGLEDKGLQRPFAVAAAAMVDYSLASIQGDAYRMHSLTRQHILQRYGAISELTEATPRLVAAYCTPDTLVQETLVRGFDAVLADLRETQIAVPADHPAVLPLAELRRYFDWEAYHLRAQYPEANPNLDGGQYLIQHLRERVYHQGINSRLSDDFDNWLEKHQVPHFRSHEAWRHPHDSTLLLIFKGHNHSVDAVTFAPNGRIFLSGSVDGTLRLWDTISGLELGCFKGHKDWVRAVAFAPDGYTALSGSRDGTLRLWDIANGMESHCFEGHKGWVHTVAFAPDGQTILSGSEDGTVRLWDINGIELRCFEGHNSSINAVAFAPDGRTVLSGSADCTLRLWDMTNGLELSRFKGHGGEVNAAAFAPDGQTVLSGSADTTLRLWNVTSGLELSRFEGHSREVNAVAFAPNGQTILSGSADRTLRLWNVTSGLELSRFEGHSSEVNAVAFAPDGQTVLSGSADTTLRLWNITQKHELHNSQKHNDCVNAVAFAPDGQTILSGSADRTLRLWNAATGTELRRFADHNREVNAVAFAPDGQTILSGSADTTLRLWDVASGAELRRFTGHKEEINAVSFAPDGSTVLSGSADKTMRLWDVTNGMELRCFKGHSGVVGTVAFASDGRTVLSGSGDATLRLWDVVSGTEVRCFRGHHLAVDAVAFAPDGRTVLSGSGDTTLRLWDVVSGAEVRCFRGHSGTVRTIAFLPDGYTVLSGSNDHTLRLWDVNSGESLAAMRLEVSDTAIATILPSVVVGDWSGGIWLLRLYIPTRE